jgi:hypothetical protein
MVTTTESCRHQSVGLGWSRVEHLSLVSARPYHSEISPEWGASPPTKRFVGPLEAGCVAAG